MFLAEIDRLLKAHDPHWRRAIFVVFLLAATHSAASVLRPLPIKALVEPPPPDSWWGQIEHSITADINRIWLYVVLIIAIELVILSFRYAAELRTSYVTERIIRSIRGDISMTLLRGPYRRLSAGGAGAVLAAASGDVDSVQRLLREALVATGVAALQLVLMLCVIFFIEKWLFWILIFEIGLLACAIAYYANWRKKVYLRKMDIEGRMLGTLSALYQKNLDIRFTGLGAPFFTRLATLARNLYNVQLTLWRRHGAYHFIVDFVIGSSAALCLVLLFVTAGSGPPPIGKFLVFAYYTVLIFPNLSQIGEAWPMINDARAALSRIRANTGAGHLEPGAQAALPSPEELHPRFGAIVFDHVTLRNDRGEMILDDVHFRIEPGEKVALAGESGTGKTSLLSLLLGLQKPTEGRVSINGRDVTTLSLADLKRFFVFARAQPAFVPGTLQDNIALHKSPDQERVADTLDRSRLASRVAVDPAGMHAHVGDKGEPFSAGEQQRIAFARVMLADPPCLIFDEALNSLDEESELWITRRMIAELDDKTVIAVSHRKSAAKLFPKRLEIVRGGKVGWVEG
jgi:ABC-type multidrug transport system fused ATPase/permease subunit